MKILVATRNDGKLAEFQHMLAATPNVHLASLLAYPQAPNVVEDADTFEENAIKKAQQTALACGTWTLADDSGLCVDALDGEPGVYSARYAGENASDQDNIDKLLMKLKDVPEAARDARFVCVLILCDDKGEVRHRVREECEGRVIDDKRGDRGFGYDPIFIATGENRSMAELPPAEKSAISHRGKATRKMVEFIKALTS